MDFKKTNAHLTIFLILLFAPGLCFSGVQDNSLVKAILLFENQNFKDAEPILEKLVEEDPANLMVNYYYGACRTENHHYGQKEIIYLLKGSAGEAPLETDYYLGVQYHAQNRWDEALKHYNLYKNKVNEQEQEEKLLSEKIQQCTDKVNPFVSTEKEDENVDVLPQAIPRKKEQYEFNPVISESIKTTEDSSETLSMETLADTVSQPTVIPNTTPVETIKEPESPTIQFVVNPEITYLNESHFKTEDGLKSYNEGVKEQNKLNWITSETEELRKQYATSQLYTERQSLGEKILAGENEIYQLQTSTKESFLQAQKSENEYWETASIEEKQAFISTMKQMLNAKNTTELNEETDTTDIIAPAILLGEADIITPTENTTEDDLVYKIQLGAYSRGLPSYIKPLFKKLSYIRKIENYTDEKGVVVYTTGNLTKYEDAVTMLEQVKQEGVDGALIVPYFNGKRITLKEAKEIEADR